MLNLETLLSPEERAQFDQLVLQAAENGAQSVGLHSEASGVLVLGLCQGGQLLTWFASPAHNRVEAEIVKAVILAGVVQASATMAALESNAGAIAATAMKKAMH